MANALKRKIQENYFTVAMDKESVDTKSGRPLIAGRLRFNNRKAGKLFLLKKEDEIA